MRRCLFIIFLAVFFYSCSRKIEIPSGIIKPLQMQNILWDMIRADILAQEMVKKDSGKNIKTESKILNEKVFLIHNINREKFESSFSFYQKHPDLMKIIFDSINAIQTRKNLKQIDKIQRERFSRPS